MRIATKEAVVYANNKFSRAPSSSPPNIMDHAVLTGIENILTPKLIKRKRACRARCINAVLDEQERQDLAGIYDADRIAFVSHQCSESAAKRAHKIGLMQST